MICVFILTYTAATLLTLGWVGRGEYDDCCRTSKCFILTRGDVANSLCIALLAGLFWWVYWGSRAYWAYADRAK